MDEVFSGGEAMIPSQMLKGTLEGCVLAIISQKETYGYEISESLSKYGFGTIKEGTIYPMLLRLEKNGFIQAIYKESELGPKRKYYRLTEEGKSNLVEFLSSYEELSNAVNHLIQDVKEGDCYEEKC